MTLQEFFDWLAINPGWVLFFFIFIPLAAAIAGWIGKGEGHLSPWKYFYTLLIYLVCIPGIFAVFLNIYLFLFERRSVFETDVFTQVLPIFSMIGSIVIIRNNVDLGLVPGFGKLSGLFTLISIILIIMFFIDRTHIIAITYIPIGWLLLIFVGLLIVARYSFKKML